MKMNEKLEELLDWSGMNQNTLAEKLGVSKGTVNAYITGRNSISFEMATKIAEVLGVSTWTMCNGEPLPATDLDITREEAALIANIRSLTIKQKELVVGIVSMIVKQNANP